MGCAAVFAGAFFGSVLGAAVGGGLLCPEPEPPPDAFLKGLECFEYKFVGSLVGLVIGVIVALGLVLRMKPSWNSSYRSPLQRSEADVHGEASEPPEVDPVADDEVESPRPGRRGQRLP